MGHLWSCYGTRFWSCYGTTLNVNIQEQKKKRPECYYQRISHKYNLFDVYFLDFLFCFLFSEEHCKDQTPLDKIDLPWQLQWPWQHPGWCSLSTLAWCLMFCLKLTVYRIHTRLYPIVRTKKLCVGGGGHNMNRWPIIGTPICIG